MKCQTSVTVSTDLYGLQNLRSCNSQNRAVGVPLDPRHAHASVDENSILIIFVAHELHPPIVHGNCQDWAIRFTVSLQTIVPVHALNDSSSAESLLQQGNIE